MSDYVPTDWVDNVTPVDATRMDKIEAGIDTADSIARAAQTAAAAAIAKAIVDAKGDLIVATAADIVARLAVGTNGHVLTADSAVGPGVKWAALPASSGVDYIGNWSSAVTYKQGDVVLYNGVQYIAVNPGTNQTPPASPGATGVASVISLVTTLPGSPFDGQEVDLTDSLTTPSWVWRFRYVAASPTNKWKFVGGAPLFDEITTGETTSSGTYVALTTPGPSLTVPVAGDYLVEVGCNAYTPTAAGAYMSYAIGATAAVDADAALSIVHGTRSSDLVRERKKLALPAATVLAARYRTDSGSSFTFSGRRMRVLPVAVG